MASPASNVASAAAAPVLQPGAQAAGAHQQVPVAPAMPGANRVDAAVTFSSVAPGDDNWTQVKIIHDIRELQHHYTQDKIWMNETVKVDDNHAAMIDRNANAIQKMHAIVIEQDRAHHTMVQALREEFATMVRLLEDDHQKKGQEMDGVKKEVMGVADIRGQMDMLRQQVVQQDLRGPHQELRGQLDAVHRQLLQQDSGHLQRLEEVKTETEKVLYQMRDEIVALQMHAKSQAAAAAAPPRAPDPRLAQAAARVEARSVGETLKSEFVDMLKALQAFLCEVDDKVAAMEIQIADNYGRQDLRADAQASPQERMAAVAAVQPEAAKPSFLGQFRQNHNGHEGAQHFSVATLGGSSVSGAGHGRADYFGGTPAVDPAKGYPCSGPHGGVEHRGGACQQGLPQGAHGIPHLPGVYPPVHAAHRQAGAGPQAGWEGRRKEDTAAVEVEDMVAEADSASSHTTSTSTRSSSTKRQLKSSTSTTGSLVAQCGGRRSPRTSSAARRIFERCCHGPRSRRTLSLTTALMSSERPMAARCHRGSSAGMSGGF